MLGERFFRFGVSSTIGFKLFLKRVRQSCNIKDCLVKYVDGDGELVTLDSKYSLQFALKDAIAKASSAVDQPSEPSLRIHVVPVEPTMVAEGSESDEPENVASPNVSTATSAHVSTPAQPARACAEAPKSECPRFCPADAGRKRAYFAQLLQEIIPQIVDGVSDRVSERVLSTLPAEISRIMSVKATSSAPSSDVMHPHVRCDGCDQPVRGARFKCMTCPDFDLCEECEKTNEHTSVHIFAKLRFPVAANIVTHTYVENGDEDEMDDVPLASVPRPAQPATPLVPVTAPLHTSSATSASLASTAGTGAASTAAQADDACDSDADSRQSFELVEEEPADGAVDMVADAVAVAPAPVQAYCTFLGDASLQDGATVRAGDVVTKTWIVRNSGDEEWPLGTKLTFVDGDIKGACSSFSVTRAAPLTDVAVTVQLVVPAVAQPTTLTSVWRLASPAGVFGHQLWARLKCVPNPRLPVPAAPTPATATATVPVPVAVSPVPATPVNTAPVETTDKPAVDGGFAIVDAAAAPMSAASSVAAVASTPATPAPSLSSLSLAASEAVAVAPTVTGPVPASPAATKPASPAVPVGTAPAAPPAPACLAADIAPASAACHAPPSYSTFFPGTNIPRYYQPVGPSPVPAPGHPAAPPLWDDTAAQCFMQDWLPMPVFPAPAPAPGPAPAPAPGPVVPSVSGDLFDGPYASQQMTMMEMGFEDLALNRQLLDRYQGDLDKAMDAALQG